ncbi:glycosyltransferase family 4 protein [Desulfothermus naphthae]
MKIAFLSHLDLNLYLFRLPIMVELVKRNYRVFAVCPKGEYFEKFKDFGVIAVDYEIERNSLNPFKELKTICSIKNSINKINADILHTFMHKPNIYGNLTGHKKRINTVTGLGSFFVHNNAKSKVVRKIIEFLYKMTTKDTKAIVFQNGDDYKYFIEKNIVSKDKAVVIRSSGIDTEMFNPAPKPINLIKKFDLNLQKPIILMIARVIKDKGVLEYIEAAEILKEKAQFVYVGDVDKGNKNAFLPDWKSVKWLGFQKNIKEIIAMSDIVTLPSFYREGVPRTLLEAGSMGKPLVTTDVTGCREVVKNNFNGFLVPARNPIELAKAIEKLINNKQLREQFGKNSREYIKKNFDIKIVVSKYLELYNFVLTS